MTKFQTKWYLGNSVCSLVPIKHEDGRGFMSEIYQKKTLEELGINENFVQENQSFTKEKFTFRGLHFQKPPFEQAKLIRVLQGSILDFIVDLRASSPTYLQYEAITLSAKNFKQVYIPSGFAHGFLTLEENCEITYKISNYYDQPSDASISIFDPALRISLPCEREEVEMSEKDLNAKNWESMGEIF
jgi:dTDP-4-dehydrorhamnose 3,5-epimerase